MGFNLGKAISNVTNSVSNAVDDAINAPGKFINDPGGTVGDFRDWLTETPEGAAATLALGPVTGGLTFLNYGIDFLTDDDNSLRNLINDFNGTNDLLDKLEQQKIEQEKLAQANREYGEKQREIQLEELSLQRKENNRQRTTALQQLEESKRRARGAVASAGTRGGSSFSRVETQSRRAADEILAGYKTNRQTFDLNERSIENAYQKSLAGLEYNAQIADINYDYGVASTKYTWLTSTLDIGGTAISLISGAQGLTT